MWGLIILAVVIFFALLLRKMSPKAAARPETSPENRIKHQEETSLPQKARAINSDDSAPSTLYGKAKDFAQCLFDFPYKEPSSVPPSVRLDGPLMEIITGGYQTTIGPDGNTRQTTIDASDRIKLQAEFKTRIYALLDNCLAEDPEYAPALLLYPKVADWNTRAADRRFLIELYERLLPAAERVTKGRELIASSRGTLKEWEVTTSRRWKGIYRSFIMNSDSSI